MKILAKIINLIRVQGWVELLRTGGDRLFFKCYNELFLRLSGVCVGRGIKYEGLLRVYGGKRVRIGDYAQFGSGVIVEAAQGATVEIGARTYIGRYGTVIAKKKVVIGCDCLIAPFGYIIDADHGRQPDIPMCKQDMVKCPIRIGNNVWLGVGVAVLKGVVIGDGAIVGARSVVTRSLEAASVSAGSPARPIA